MDLRAFILAKARGADPLAAPPSAAPLADPTLAQLGLDSFALVEVVLDVERAAGRPLDLEVLRGRVSPGTTLGELTALLDQGLAQCPPPPPAD